MNEGTYKRIIVAPIHAVDLTIHVILYNAQYHTLAYLQIVQRRRLATVLGVTRYISNALRNIITFVVTKYYNEIR